MKNNNLQEVINRITREFGKEIIAERRFVYMIADCYSFRDNPAEKHVLSTLVNNGYSARLLKQNRRQDISVITNQIVNEVCKNYGFKEELVTEVVSCIIGKSCNYQNKQSSGKKVHSSNMVPQSQKGNKDISLYSCEDLKAILVDIFMLPLRSGCDRVMQETTVKQRLGDDEGKFVLDFFLKDGVVKWSPTLHSYYTTYGDTLEFIKHLKKSVRK